MIVPLLLPLAACATYHASPLEDDPAVLAPPVADALTRAASAVQRPWLAPVTVDLSKPLTPEGLAAIAVINNPDLIALRARAGVSDAQVFAAGLLPDPSFSFGANKVLSGPDPLLDMAGALGFDLNALRTRAVSRRMAVAQARQVRSDLAWAEWQTAGRARLQAVKIAALTSIVALAQASRNTAHSLFVRQADAAARGDIAGDRLQSARIALLAANEQLQASQSQLAAAELDLRRELGLPPGYVLRIAPPRLPAPPPPLAKLFALAQVNRADLAALRAGYASQEESVRKAILEQFPALSLTINGARDSAGNVLTGPAVGLTLPLWNRNRGTIAIQRATRAALKAEYEARLFQTRADIAAAAAGLAIAYRQRDAALRQMPQLERFAASAQQAAERGDVALATALNAAQAVRDRKLALAQAEQNIAEQSIALELLTGTPREAWPR